MTLSESSIPSTQVDSFLSRRVAGKGLFELLHQLEPFDTNDAISLPRDSGGELDPRVILVKDRDLYANSQRLKPLKLASEVLVPEITARLPKLAEPIAKVATNGIAWDRPTQTRHNYLSLCFEPEVTRLLAEEQHDIWHELPRIANANGSLRWDPYEPRVLVMALAAGIKHSTVARIRMHIMKRGPFEVTLLPLGEDRTASAD